MKKIFLWFLVIVISMAMIASFSLTSCKGEEPAEEAAEEPAEEAAEEAAEEVTEEAAEPIDELVVGVGEDISGLDIQSARGGAAAMQMMALMFNGLVTLDDAGEIVPSLAESWEVSDDGLEYTFKLTEGVKFHNGRELVADDVKWSIDRYRMEEVGFPYITDFDKIETIEVIDEYTVKFVISEPYGPFLSGFATGQRGIVPKEAYSGDDIPEFLGVSIGTGPYTFVEWDTENFLKLEAFEDYWAGAPTVKKMTFRIISEDAVRITALKTGEIDLTIGAPLDEVVKYKENPDDNYVMELIEGSSNTVYFLPMDTTTPPFDDARVRRAVQLTLDSQVIIDTIFFGIGEIADDVYAEDTYWDVDYDINERDIAKAKELLIEAGYEDGVTVRIGSCEEYNMNKINEVIQAQLAEIGMTVEIVSFEWSAWLQAPRDWDEAGIDACTNFTYPLSDPNTWQVLIVHSDGLANWLNGWYKNPEIDALIEESTTTSSNDDRKELYTQIFQMQYDDAASIWMVLIPMIFGYSNELVGFDVNFRGDFEFDNNKGLPWMTTK